MAYGDVREKFMGILNRRDITPSLVTTFMDFAIQRIHEELRVPAMEQLTSFTMDGTGVMNIPGDLLEIISVSVNDSVNGSRKLGKVDLKTILDWSQVSGQPQFYHRQAGNLYIGPYPAAGSVIWLNYYKDSTTLAADTDVNWLTEVAPMLLIYGALSVAADYFLDDRKQLFEATYAQTRDRLRDMAIQDEVVNASIRPGLAFDTNISGSWSTF